MARDADQHVLRIELAADAEAAADMRFVHMDRGRRELEHAREQVAIAVRHLGGAVQFEDVAGGVVAADGAARFERHTGMATDPELELHDHGCGAKHRIDVAIALLDHGDFGVAAGREFARLGFGGEQDRQFLDLQHDEIGRVFRHVGILGEDRDDGVPDIAHLVDGEHRLPVRLERGNPSLAKIDRRDVRDVGRGPDRDDARARRARPTYRSP